MYNPLNPHLKEVNLEKRYLGKARLEVSALGLGCAAFTDFYGSHFDEKEASATVRRALELGVTFFDVADIYGNHRNEEILGRALGNDRARAVIATKFGFTAGPDGAINGICGRPDYVRQACEASLKALGTDHIDLYYQHRVDPGVPIEDTVGAMAALVKAGKVRFLGLSEASADTLRRAMAVHPITALQTEYSLWSRDIEEEILPACRKLGIGFVPYSPLGRGFLTGEVKKTEELAAADFRKYLPRFQAGLMEKNLEALKDLEALAATKRCRPSQLALAWVLSRGADIVPIPGTKRRKYLEENLGALEVKLAPEELVKLDGISRRFVGTRYSERGMKMVNL
jgi:aryl-alcohol dehydrogenase-like predicted oxidoreductase